MKYNSPFSKLESHTALVESREINSSETDSIKIRIAQISQELTRVRLFSQVDPQENLLLSRVIKCCEELIIGSILSNTPQEEILASIQYKINKISNKSNEKRVIGILVRLSQSEPNTSPLMPYIDELIGLADELDKRKVSKRSSLEFNRDTESMIKIDKDSLSSLSYSVVKSRKRVKSTECDNPYLQRRNDFFSLVVNRKLVLSKRHPSHSLSIEELYQEAMDLDIRRDEWNHFINSKFNI